jgi:hypothetical protein
MVKSRKSVKHIRGKNTRTLMVKNGGVCVCFHVSACAAIKLKLFSLSLFLSLVCIHIVPDIRRKRKPLCLSVFLSLSETPKGTQTSFFFLLGAATGVLRAIFGAFLGWAQALVAYGRYARRKKEQRVVGG